MSQEDVYNITKEIFGEELAQWAIYAKSDEEIGTYSYNYNIKVTTPNGKGQYNLARTIEKKSRSGEYLFELSVDFTDSGASSKYKHNINKYVPCDMEFEIKDFFDGEVGGTDLLNSTEFFNKALNCTGENKFVHTSLSSVTKEYINFQDGSIYNKYQIVADPGVLRLGFNDTVPVALEGSQTSNLNIEAMKNKDGKINIKSFSWELPTGSIESDKGTDESKVQKLLSASVKKVSEIFAIPEKEIKDNLTKSEIDDNFSVLTRKINVLDTSVMANIVFCVTDSCSKGVVDISLADE